MRQISIGALAVTAALAAAAAVPGLAAARPDHGASRLAAAHPGHGGSRHAASPDPAAAAQGPTGYDTYRRLDLLPQLTTGVQTHQFSSFDRTGGNDDGFAGTYSCLTTTADGCVIAQAQGAGELDSIWFTRDEGDVTKTGTITIELDGRTVLHASLQDVVDGKLGAPFSFPLVANADQSSGGVTITVPMSYRHSMRITTQANPDFYHVTYRSFASAAGVTTFDPSDPAPDVLDTLRASGTADPKPARPGAATTSRQVSLAPGQTQTLADLSGPGEISAVKLRLPQLVGPDTQYIADDGDAFGGASGSSQFTATIDPANQGVRLTRRVDRTIGNQQAQIFVDGQHVADWAPLPVQGGCSWYDQTVQLPASATAGKSQITIRNQFVSSDLDFNEFKYTVDSIVDGQPVQTDSLDVGADHSADEQAHQFAITGQTWQGTHTYCYPPTAAEQAAVAPSDAILRDARIRVSFDGQPTVDAPLGEFFGSGLGLYKVRALMMAIDPSTQTLSAWWPMPYRSHAVVQLYNGSNRSITGASSSVTAAPSPDVRAGLGANGDLGYFHATSNRKTTTTGKDYVFLDATGQGKYLGATHTMEGNIPSGNEREYLEGDERVYEDGSLTPQLQGTGTEDFYEGGWYFNREVFTDPFNGNTAHEGAGFLGCRYDCTGTYRLLLGDEVSFGSGLRFGIEHGPADNKSAVYGSTAYWYGRTAPSLTQTDLLNVGNVASEEGHGYTTRDAGDRSTLTATFEGDSDSTRVTDDLRATTARVSFRLRVGADNDGVTLRRRSDQSVGYQSAAVTVDGVPAGTWTEPLHNTTHRWLEDTFQLPARLTAGRRTIRVTLTPVAGAPAWSAARYVALARGQS